MSLPFRDTLQSESNLTGKSNYFQDLQESAAFINVPTFDIPKVPDFVKVKDQQLYLDSKNPLTRKAPPPPGYDMKTLRNQVQYLQDELVENYKANQIVSRQNEELWQYVQDLLIANKSNTQKMKDHVNQLHHELKELYQQRASLQEKIEMAKHSQQMMLSLNEELKQQQHNLSVKLTSKQATNQELLSIQEENEILQQYLQEKQQELNRYQDQLNAYQDLQREMELDNQSDHFYYTNHIHLKVAYHRFRKQIVKQKRLHKIQDIFHDLHECYLYTICFNSWKRFRMIQLVIKHKTEQKNYGIQHYYWTKWKYLLTMAKVITFKGKKSLLSHYFQSWKAHRLQLQYEHTLNQRCENYKNYLLIKQLFCAWRDQITFLAWNSNQNLILEQTVSRPFRLLKLFNHWKAYIKQTKQSKYFMIHQIERNHLKYIWLNWYQLCLRRWDRKVKLLQRFFRVLKSKVIHKHHSQFEYHLAQKHFLASSKSQVFVKLRLFMKKSKKFQQSIGFPAKFQKVLRKSRQNHEIYNEIYQMTSHLMYFNPYKQLKTSFLQFSYQLLQFQRQRALMTMGIRHFSIRSIKKLFSYWTTLSRQQRNIAIYSRYKQISRLWKRWRVFFLSKQQIYNKLNHVPSLSLRFKQKSFRYWQYVTQRTISLKTNISIYYQLKHEKLLIKVFNQWIRLFSRRLYWKYRECVVDRDRLTSITSLHEESLQHLNSEHIQLIQQNNQLGSTCQSLESLIKEKQDELERRKEQQLLQEEEHRVLKAKQEEILEHLTQLQSQYHKIESYHYQLQLEHSRSQQDYEDKIKQIQSKLHSIRQENQHLQSTQQIQTTEGVEVLRASIVNFEELQSKQEELVQQLALKQREINELTKAEEEVLQDINTMQLKINQLQNKSEQFLSENDSLLRSKLASLQTLRSDAGIANARVQALCEVVQEFEQNQKQESYSEIFAEEQKELSELKSLQRDYERQREDILSNGVTPLRSAHSISYNETSSLGLDRLPTSYQLDNTLTQNQSRLYSPSFLSQSLPALNAQDLSTSQN